MIHSSAIIILWNTSTYNANLKNLLTVCMEEKYNFVNIIRDFETHLHIQPLNFLREYRRSSLNKLKLLIFFGDQGQTLTCYSPYFSIENFEHLILTDRTSKFTGKYRSVLMFLGEICGFCRMRGSLSSFPLLRLHNIILVHRGTSHLHLFHSILSTSKNLLNKINCYISISILYIFCQLSYD